MTSEDFWDEFEKLTFAFSVQKPEQKSKIYFEHLRSIELDTFSKAVKECVKECDRFPTISRLIQSCAKISPMIGRKVVRCDQCDGMGTVSRWKHTFRARCIHGEQVSQQMMLAGRDEGDWSRIYFYLNRDWIKAYGKELDGEMVSVDPLEPIVRKAQDLFA